jgi:hypothetical protein
MVATGLKCPYVRLWVSFLVWDPVVFRAEVWRAETPDLQLKGGEQGPALSTHARFQNQQCSSTGSIAPYSSVKHFPDLPKLTHQVLSPGACQTSLYFPGEETVLSPMGRQPPRYPYPLTTLQ